MIGNSQERFYKRKDIYNPWSILNYLDTKTAAPYWVNTGSNQLISKLLQEGNKEVKSGKKYKKCCEK